jgi:phosphatidylglycerol---prolipoprotein diacylglyceryl transferase
MHPTILKLGPLYIKAYGLMLAISFVLGIWLATARGKKYNISSQQIMDLSIWVLVAAIVGSRFYYVVTHWPEFSGNLIGIISPVQNGEVVGIAGLSMQGGVILSLVVGYAYMRIKKLDVWLTMDVMAPSFLLGMAITRIGCFFNGCCFGKPTTSCLGVVFPPDSAAGWFLPGLHLHPTQLYSSLAGFAMLGLVLFLERYKKFAGFTFLLVMLLDFIFRFCIDFVRFYEKEMTVFTIGGIKIINNQLISLAFIIFSISFLVYLNHKRKHEKKPQ